MTKSLRQTGKERTAARASKRAYNPEIVPKEHRTTEALRQIIDPGVGTTTIGTGTGTGNTPPLTLGLPVVLPENIAADLPKFDPNAYKVTDPLNPPESLPQVSKTQYEKASGIYQGATDAVKLTGMAFDLKRETYNTQGKQYKAASAGVKAATDLEHLKGDVLDNLVAREGTAQKSTNLEVAKYTTITTSAIAQHKKQELSAQVEAARIKAESASTKNITAQATFEKLLAESQTSK